MASAPTPDPSQGGAPQGGAPPDPSAGGGAPSAAPASPEMIMLSKISMALQQLAQTKPEASAGCQKAVQGINEAQSAIATGPQQQAPSSSPPY